MARKKRKATQYLAVLLALGMLYGVAPAWAVDEDIVIGIADSPVEETVFLEDGDTLTVENGGLVDVEAEDDDVTAVRSEDPTGISNDDDITPTYGFTNGAVTVNAGGAITATATGDVNLSDIYARAVEAEDGDINSTNITNSGEMVATVDVDYASYTAHAFTIQVHSGDDDEGSVNITNNAGGTITATADNSGEATARAIQLGGYFTPSADDDDDFAVEVSNAGTIEVDAISTGDQASARGVHTGGYIEGLSFSNAATGTIDLYAEAADGNAGAWVIQTGGYGENFSISNAGEIIAEAYSKDGGDANATWIHTGGYIEGFEISNAAGATIAITATADDGNANAQGIHVGEEITPLAAEDLTGLDISNAGTLEVTAFGDDDASAQGIHTGGNITGLNISNAATGTITVQAFSSYNTTSATGIKAENGVNSEDAEEEEVPGVISNAGTIEVLAKNYEDNDAEARGIHVGEGNSYTTDGFIDIANAGGAEIIVKAESVDDGKALAWGIHAGQDVVGLIANAGLIQVTADGGDESKAIGVQVGSGLELENNAGGSINVDLIVKAFFDEDLGEDVRYEGDVAGSRAIGVFAADHENGDVIDILNAANATIDVSAYYYIDGDLGDGESDNAGAMGIKVGAGGNGSQVRLDTIISNEGKIIADSDIIITGFLEGNSGSFGIRTTEVYANAALGREDEDENPIADAFTFIENGGTIEATTYILAEDGIGGNSGAFGIRGAYTRTAADNAFAESIIDNSGYIYAEAEMEVPTDSDEVYIGGNAGAFAIRAGEAYSYNTGSEASFTVTNSGTLEAVATMTSGFYMEGNSGAFGIRIGQPVYSDDTTYVLNEGVILATATLTADEMGDSMGAFGIRAGGGHEIEDGVYNNNIINTGSITVTATIDAGETGIYYNSPEYFDEDNYGHSHNQGGLGAYGIRTGTAKVVNTGDITATATFLGANDGEYAGMYDGAYGIRTGDGEATVVHSGTITATVFDEDDTTTQLAVGIMTGQDENEIHLSGSVTATANGSGEAYSIIMGCDGDGGSDNTNSLFVMNGASLTGDVRNDGDGIANVVFGLAMSSEEGTEGMAIEGEVDPDFMFTFDGSFLGNNAGWNAEMLGGTLAGNIYIDGDYTQSADATYRALLGDGAEIELEVSGTATFDEGALIDIGVNGYVPGEGEEYTLVSAGSLDLDGLTEEEVLTESSIVLDYEVVDDGDANTIVVAASRTPYSSLPISGNQAVLGNALIDAAGDGFGDAADFLAIVDNCSTAECLNEALGSLSPEQYPNLLDIGMAGSALYRSTVAARMGNLHLTQGNQSSAFASNTMTDGGPALARMPAFERTAGGWSGWARVIGTTGDQDKDNGVEGYEFDTAGVSLGFDNKISENLTLGFGLGMNNTDVDYDVSTRSADVDSYNVALYGTYSTPQMYIDGAILYADSEYDSDRYNTVLGERITSDTDGDEWGLYIGGGYNLVDNTDWFFIPTASFEWAAAEIDGFTEQGSALGLDVHSFDADSAVTNLGFRLGANLAMGAAKIVPELRLSWAHEFGDTERDVKASFIGGSSTFSIEGIEPERDGALVGVGVNAYLNESMSLFVDYDGEFRSDFDGHSISGGLRYNF